MIDVQMIPAISLLREDFQQHPFWRRQLRRIRQVADKPGWIWATNDPMLPGHFGNYFAAMTTRDYSGDALLRSLYYVHEFEHAGYRYDPTCSPLDWKRNVIASEFQASFTSEVEVYLQMPELRTEASPFTHEIWMDRFLQDRRLMEKPLQRIRAYIKRQRIRALANPIYNDFIERQIRNYYDQNFVWCGIWERPVGYGPYAAYPAYLVVETHMAHMRTLPYAEAEPFHRNWLRAVTPQDGRPEIPFLQQAQAFEGVYRNTNEQFGNWRLQQTGTLPPLYL